jgi:hypothetical protein
MVKTAAATALAALALSGAAAGAANISAPVPARGFDSPPERLLVQYSGSVLFIRAADIGISAEYPNNGTTYAATATFQSAGLLRWFDDTDIQAGVSGYVNSGGLQPWRYSHFNHASGTGRTVGIDFPDGVAMPDIDPPFGSMGEPPATDEERDGALDPITTILGLMLGMPDPANGVCEGRLPVFDGKARYDLRLVNAGMDSIRTRAWRGEALLCQAYMEPISGYDEGKRPTASDTHRPVSIWLAEIDGVHVPVRFQTGTRIGNITISAVNVEVG